MTSHSAFFSVNASHAHATLLEVATGVATGLLAIASTIALGSVGIDAAVLVIAVLTPLVLLGAVSLTRDEA
jgi:hypothetical protein